MNDRSEYPRAALEVVCVALTVREVPQSSMALHAAFAHSGQASLGAAWALSSSPVHRDESLDDAAQRLLRHVGVSPRYIEQLEASCTSDVEGERVVTIAYYGLVSGQERTTTEAVEWFPIAALPELPSRHHSWVMRAVRRVRENIRRTPAGFGLVANARPRAEQLRDPGKSVANDDPEKSWPRDGGGVFGLLPPRFSLTHLQQLLEAIEGTTFDKRNFRKKILATGLLIETDEVEQGVRHRAARLYRFDRRKYDRIAQTGSP